MLVYQKIVRFVTKKEPFELQFTFGKGMFIFNINGTNLKEKIIL